MEITYVGELKHDAEVDGIRSTLPTKIVPRYGDVPEALGKVRFQEESGISITVDVDVGETSQIQSLKSPSHPVAITIGNTSKTKGYPKWYPGSATIALENSQLDKDFVILFSNKVIGNPTAFLETHPPIRNQRALMVDLVPKFSLPPNRPEIIFDADHSGSIGPQIPTLKSALKVFLKSFPVGVKLNILSFGSTHSFLWPKSKAYNNESLMQAMEHVKTFGSNMGGTETYAAIQATIQNRFTDLSCEILLLIDGDIWNQQGLFDYLNKAVGNRIRVFTLGIGSGVSSALIEGVARAGKGFTQTVVEGEKMDKKVVRMLKGALSTHISDCAMELKYESPKGKEQDMEWEMV